MRYWLFRASFSVSKSFWKHVLREGGALGKMMDLILKIFTASFSSFFRAIILKPPHATLIRLFEFRECTETEQILDRQVVIKRLVAVGFEHRTFLS